MARNGLAGTKKGSSKSAIYYQNNPKAKDKKDKYNTKYHKSKLRKLYRAFLNRINKNKGSKGDEKDVSHKADGGTVLEYQSQNRARNRDKKA